MAFFTFLSLLFSPSMILLFLSLLFLSKMLFMRSTPLKLPPGPPQLPILGNLHQVGMPTQHMLESLSKKYGPVIHLKLGRIPTLAVSSAKLAKEVLKYQDNDFCSRPPFVSQIRLSYNMKDIAFAPYGEYWRDMRKVCMIELFNPKRIQSFGFIREEEVSQMIASISKSCSPSKPINLSQMLLVLTSNIVCRAAFGKRYIGGGSEKSDFDKVFEETQALFMAFFFADFLPWLGWIDKINGQDARLEKNFFDLDAFYEKVIDEHMDPNRPKLEHEDFVDVLLKVEKNLGLTKDHVKGILMNILVAGTDTGAATLTWGMAELVRNPRVLKKAQDEVRSIIGHKNKVEEDDIPKLPYLKLVLKEIYRLHPAAPLLVAHETIRHCKLDGYDVLPKTMVFVNAGAIGRDPECWENPKEFMPERFTDSEIDIKGQHFELIPFGAGRRICPGMNFGVVSVELALANLLYFFNWEMPYGVRKEDLDMGEAPGITTHKKVDLLLVATKYNSAISV